MIILQRQATKVAYIVDGDNGGEQLRKKLTKAGVPEDLIVDLSHICEDAKEVEDFVDKSVYANAVNEELKRSGIQSEIEIDMVADQARSNNLKEWCKDRNISPPNKAKIAYRILEQSIEREISDKSKRGSLRQIYDNLKEIFKKESDVSSWLGR